jgi:molybdate transport system ATP-binding protein
LQLEVQGTLAIIGPNGAGKTTLLSLLLGALPVQRGRIVASGAVLLDTKTGVNVAIEQRRIGFVPQDYALFPHLSVRENIEFALGSGQPKLARAARSERARSVLHDLGLSAQAEQRPVTLSGGAKQRVALARALSVNPRALLLDEPLAALDVRARREVRAFLSSYLSNLSMPAVVVTHDAADARVLARRVAVLEAGRITQIGTWQELVQNPATAFVREFVAGET